MPNHMAFYNEIVSLARRGMLSADLANGVWALYLQALSGGGLHLDDAGAEWGRLLAEIRDGRVSTASALAAWESFLATGKATELSTVTAPLATSALSAPIKQRALLYQNLPSPPNRAASDPRRGGYGDWGGVGTFEAGVFDSPREALRRYAGPRSDVFYNAGGGDNFMVAGACLDSECKLEVFIDDRALSSAMKVAKAKAMAQRARMGPLAGNYTGDTRLGGPYTTERETPGLVIGQAAIQRVRQTQAAFLAVLTYDCECVVSADLEWYFDEYSRDKKTGKLSRSKLIPDPPRRNAVTGQPDGTWSQHKDAMRWWMDQVTATSSDGEEIGGKCWKAAIDTPSRTKARPVGSRDRGELPDPQPKFGAWVIIGKVKWENGNECEVRKIVSLLPFSEPMLEVMDFPVPASR